jgi:hypothetical protein
MTVLTILAKAAMPCIVATAGITVGTVHHKAIERAVRRVYHRPAPRVAHKPVPRPVIAATACIMPTAGSVEPVILPTSQPESRQPAMGVTGDGYWWIGNPPIRGAYTPATPTVAPPPSAIVSSAPPLPELGVWAMMIAGIGAIGGVVRTRRQGEAA